MFGLQFLGESLEETRAEQPLEQRNDPINFNVTGGWSSNPMERQQHGDVDHGGRQQQVTPHAPDLAPMTPSAPQPQSMTGFPGLDQHNTNRPPGLQPQNPTGIPTQNPIIVPDRQPQNPIDIHGLDQQNPAVSSACGPPIGFNTAYQYQIPNLWSTGYNIPSASSMSQQQHEIMQSSSQQLQQMMFGEQAPQGISVGFGESQAGLYGANQAGGGLPSGNQPQQIGGQGQPSALSGLGGFPSLSAGDSGTASVESSADQNRDRRALFERDLPTSKKNSDKSRSVVFEDLVK